MRTFFISDPDDQTNPFEGLACETMLIYHGTNSMFCTPIEEKGLLFDAFDAAFGWQVQEIITACDKLHVGPDGLASARGFSSKRQVYLSAMFPSARGYARNIGGERIDGALRAAIGFLSFVRDSHRVQVQAAHWERVLMQNGLHLETEQVLANLRNCDLLGKLADQVESAQSKLYASVSQGFPSFTRFVRIENGLGPSRQLRPAVTENHLAAFALTRYCPWTSSGGSIIQTASQRKAIERLRVI